MCAPNHIYTKFFEELCSFRKDKMLCIMIIHIFIKFIKVKKFEE